MLKNCRRSVLQDLVMQLPPGEQVYKRLVKGLHLNPESKLVFFFNRLSEDRIAKGEIVS